MAEDRMELFIETLTGAAFELKVSPFETIISIKAKIQYLEGIPVSQQHLIWRSQELLDDYCLQDYCITDGATLKLVLGMRGGPINTRQVPADNKRLQDLAEYVEKRSIGFADHSFAEQGLFRECNSHDQQKFHDGTSSGRPFTVLVFHDGDKVHMYTLLERGECSVSPLSGTISETSSIASAKNSVEDEVEDSERLKENELTRGKMARLQEQIKALNLNKPKRKIRSSPPATAGVAVSSAKTKSLTRNATSGQHLKLPPLQPSSSSGSQVVTKQLRKNSRTSIAHSEKMPNTIDKSVFSRWAPLAGSRAPSLSSSIDSRESVEIELQRKGISKGVNTDLNAANTDVLQEENNSASTTVKQEANSISSPLLTSDEKHLKLSKDYHALHSSDRMGAVTQGSRSEDANPNSLPYLSAAQLQGANTATVDKKPFFNFPAQNAALIALGVNSPYSIIKYGPRKSKSHRHLSVTSNQALATQRFLDLDHWIDNRPKTTPQGNLYRPLDSIIEGGVWSSIGSLHAEGSRRKDKRTSKQPLSLSLPSGSRLNPLVHSMSDDRDVRWNLKSSVLFKDKADFSHSHSKTGLGALVAAGVRVLKSPSPKGSELSENTDSPPLTPSSKTTMKPSSRESSKPNSGQKLPPIRTKKKTYKRCSWCNRKTGLATSYTCRCGKNFCASHRYAELHHCSFDYKAEGRRFLQQNNPVVAAPKLPKI